MTRPACLVVSDFTVDPLLAAIARNADAPDVAASAAAFGTVLQTLHGIATAIIPAPDILLVWCRPEAVVPAYASVSRYDFPAADAVQDEVRRFGELLVAAARRVRHLLVVQWTRPPYDRALGVLSMRPGVGIAHTLMGMNLRLAQELDAAPNALLLDAERWIANVGTPAYNAKLWYLARVPFGVELFIEAAAEIKAALRAAAGQSRKLIVLDLDDTLWGGVVGEVGWENLRLGGHDGVGEAFRDFQVALGALRRTGVLLAIASKNDEQTALTAIDQHPEMVLRRSDFAGWRINWQDKAANIVDLVNELNVGLDSVVFIDDSPAERARVREACPEVLVPEWPEHKLLYPSALLGLRCFDRASITDEDAQRTEMYVSERNRKEAQRFARSLDDWLATLRIVVCVEPVGVANGRRVAQLMNKTNQFNLSARRVTERELMDWAPVDGRTLLAFRVTDRFGDYGLAGVAGLEVLADGAQISDLVLSCRVLGRGVEQVMLHALVECARAAGVGSLRATLVPTARNAPCLEFMRTRSGFTHVDSYSFSWDTSHCYPVPGYVKMARSDASIPLTVGESCDPANRP